MDSNLLNHSKQIIQTVINNQTIIFPILGYSLNSDNVLILDNSKNNIDLINIDTANTEIFTKYILNTLKINNRKIGIGKYDEDRIIYRHSKIFSNHSEPRSLHLGIDIFIDVNTPIFTPLSGTIHSYRYNSGKGDYGPTIILKHNIDDVEFYTLYGHLSVESITNIRVGQMFQAGTLLAEIGNETINGGWPPHVHFEIIVDMLGKFGDFFGVAPVSQRDYFMTLCPDPNLILQISEL